MISKSFSRTDPNLRLDHKSHGFRDLTVTIRLMSDDNCNKFVCWQIIPSNESGPHRLPGFHQSENRFDIFIQSEDQNVQGCLYMLTWFYLNCAQSFCLQKCLFFIIKYNR